MTTRAPSLKLLIHTVLLASDTAAYRHPWDRAPEDGTFERIVARALTAEEHGFDGVFFGDAPALLRDTLASTGTFPYEPLTLLSSLAARTQRLGLIATLPTQYNDPYNLARRIASLDYISGGRAAWNAVTGFLGETNFGFKEIVPPAERYHRAVEFVDLVLRLWRSWQPGYLKPDAAKTAYRSRAAAYGRSAQSIKVVPGLYAYIGATPDEALANRAATVTDEDLLVGGIATAKREYSGFDFDGLTLDDELRPEHLPTAEEIDRSARRRSRAHLFLGFANRPGATLRSFLTEIVTGTGHTNIVGSYDQVADELERWYRTDAADGFVLMGTNSLAEFLGEVVPRLERKGIYDRRPDLTTFRSRLGLPEIPVAAEGSAAA